MKIKNKKHSRIIVALLATLVVGAMLVAALEYLGVTSLSGPETYHVNSPSDEDVERRKAAEREDKRKFLEEGADVYEPAPIPSSSDAINMRLDRTGDNQVTVFTELLGYASGRCELEIVNGSRVYRRQAEVIYQPEYSICAGFSLPISELGVGMWQAKLSVYAQDGSVQTKETGFEVE